MPMNYEFERHIKATSNQAGIDALRGMQITFNALVEAGVIEELPTESVEESIEPEIVVNSLDEVTLDAWRSPSHAGRILELLYEPHMSAASATGRSTLSQSRRALERFIVGGYDKNKHSLSELCQLADDELLGFNNFGKMGLAFFREFTQPVLERFRIPKQFP